MTEETTAEAPSNILVAEYPGLPGQQSFDCATIPAAARLDFLKGAVQRYIANRLNSHMTRHKANELVQAWDRYDAANKADPLQTVVPKPEQERPAAPDLAAAYAEAVKALTEGKIRRQTGEKKERARVDPLVKLITDTVVREFYENKRASDPKYTYPMAKKEIGTDGLAYLNARIDALVAEGHNRADLEKRRDTQYVRPAEMMLGRTETKATKELPSIL